MMPPIKTAARERRDCAAVPFGHPWRGVGEPYRSARLSLLLALVGLIASSGTAMANHPVVEPWMHATNISIAGVIAIVAALAFRRRLSILISTFIGIVAFLVFAVGGLILSVWASM